MSVTALRFKFAALTALVVFTTLGCQGDPPAEENPTGGIAVESTSSEPNGDTGACTEHIDCASAEICQDGACVPNASGGPCDAHSNCIEGEYCQYGECIPGDGGSGEGGMGCGGQLYQATAIPPNVLIVLDRSGSMEEELDNQGTKWQVALDAIGGVVTDFEGLVRFGLSLYPGLNPACDEGNGCAPGAVFVDVGPNTSTAIIDVLGFVKTCELGTPTAEALAGLTDYVGLQDLERTNFILLITDGKSTCEDPVSAVAALRNESPEIKTFVVGFGDGADPTELNGMAAAGGTALDGNLLYYQADNAQALAGAFADIAASVMSCTFVLDMVPPDPNDLYVYINDVEIERDPIHLEGWDYESKTNRITFYGSSCDLLQSGMAMDLEIVFGCPQAP
jgi:hypothetical protein